MDLRGDLIRSLPFAQPPAFPSMSRLLSGSILAVLEMTDYLRVATIRFASL
jgi:hypothetical protein